MARAMWKAFVTFDDVRVPVKLYAALEDRSVHFRLLHADDQTPVKQQMVDPSRDEPVPPEDIQRGVEVEEDVFVVLRPEELESLEPPASRDIEIEAFASTDVLDEPWYDRPYWLTPDGDDGEYAALAAALEATDTLGLAHFTMRKRRYVAALRAHQGRLVMVTLRHAGEVIPVSALPHPQGRAPSKKELQLARQLVDALAEDFDPTEYEDEYRHRVLELVEAKIEGKTLELPAPRPQRVEASLMDALEQSLSGRKGKKKAGRAEKKSGKAKKKAGSTSKKKGARVA